MEKIRYFELKVRLLKNGDIWILCYAGEKELKVFDKSILDLFNDNKEIILYLTNDDASYLSWEFDWLFERDDFETVSSNDEIISRIENDQKILDKILNRR